MTPALLILTAIFLLLLVGRVGAARRRVLVPQWPSILFAGAAMFALIRGAFTPALGLAGLAVAAWFITPMLRLRASVSQSPQAPDRAELEALRLLGLRPGASEQAIRAAYRTKMAQAHPDRGGSHAEAAKLTAARDRLLRRRG